MSQNQVVCVLLSLTLAGPSVTSQAAAQVVGNTLWERLRASWGSKTTAAVINTTIRQRYAGEGDSCLSLISTATTLVSTKEHGRGG